MWTLRHFVAAEFEYPELVDEHTLDLVDEMRHQEHGVYVTIRSDYRPGDPGWHGRGKALDIVIWAQATRLPLPLISQFIIANRYMWTGIGVYPFWATPGIHVDTRPMTVYGRKAMWWRNEAGEYKGILSMPW